VCRARYADSVCTSDGAAARDLLACALLALAGAAACSADPPQRVPRNLVYEAGAESGVWDAALEATLPDARPERGDGGPSAGIPGRLSETGLYADIVSDRLAPGVEAYRPRFELWTDGAAKRRWLHLPPGARIDSRDPDDWVFPVGTKVWKEFTRDGIRVETRLFHKTAEGPEGWQFVAYVWDAQKTDAIAAPGGARNASGTAHDVPSQADCAACHSGSPDMLLGVSAVQLGHDTSPLGAGEREALGVTLETLASSGALTVEPASTHVPLAGSPLDQAALGLLHADCGHCHRPGALAWDRVELDLHLTVQTASVLDATGAFRTAVGVPTDRIFDGNEARIAPGAPGQSAVYVRMATRDILLAMPPIATKDVDTEGAQTVHDWIAALPRSAEDGGTPDAASMVDAADP
jgi:hypothetical protein